MIDDPEGFSPSTIALSHADCSSCRLQMIDTQSYTAVDLFHHHTMALLESICAGRPLQKVGGIEHDASASSLVQTLQISHKYDALVLQVNIENWGLDLAQFTPQTISVPLTLAHGSLFQAYENFKHAAVVAAYLASGEPSRPLIPEEELTALGPQIQRAIDELSGVDQSAVRCFMKLSAQSPKDAAARSGVFEAHHPQALRDVPGLDDKQKLWVLCASEGAALRQTPPLCNYTVPINIGPYGRHIAVRVCANCVPRLIDSAQLNFTISAIHTVYDALWPILAAHGFNACVQDFDATNPFEETTDGVLFSWTQERDVIKGTAEHDFIEGKTEGVDYLVVQITECKRTGALAMISRS
ncbi:hypothetical protein C8R44DRAFT_876871 [Mycena epipterygia]|nr:hypothetical protein C8R44DRAFT_876871 [Mycena epipterygia]